MARRRFVLEATLARYGSHLVHVRLHGVLIRTRCAPPALIMRERAEVRGRAFQQVHLVLVLVRAPFRRPSCPPRCPSSARSAELGRRRKCSLSQAAVGPQVVCGGGGGSGCEGGSSLAHRGGRCTFPSLQRHSMAATAGSSAASDGRRGAPRCQYNGSEGGAPPPALAFSAQAAANTAPSGPTTCSAAASGL